MEKKDIYEHLAKIYLDASSKKKKKSKNQQYIFKYIAFASFIFIFGLSFALIFSGRREKAYNTELALVLLHETAKLNFHFDPAKKETFSLDLKNLDVTKYRSLAFSAKQANYEDTVSMRIELVNAFKEKSEFYIENVPTKWQDYIIVFSKFKNITDWSEMIGLVFSVEEWNVREKKGVVYLDNVRFLKE